MGLRIYRDGVVLRCGQGVLRCGRGVLRCGRGVLRCGWGVLRCGRGQFYKLGLVSFDTFSELGRH